MNRAALKSLGILLLGVMLGCAIGRPLWWSGGAGEESGRLPNATVRSASEVRNGGGRAGSDGKAGTGKPGRERMEKLAAGFRQKSRPGSETAEVMDMALEAAALSSEEFEPLLGLLMRDDPVGDSDQADINRRTAELLAVRWAMVEPEAALAFALKQPWIKGTWHLMASIVQEAARTNLPAAKAALAQLGDGQRQQTVREVVAVLQQRDLQAALAFAREFGNQTAEAYVLESLAEKDPMAAAAELTPGRAEQRAAVERIAQQLLEQDRAKFESWAGSLTDPGQRAAARSHALAMDALTDAKGAALAMTEWLSGDPEAAAQGGIFPSRIVERWMEDGTRPSDVAAWASALPAGPFREGAVAEVARFWENVMEASAWTASLPGGRGRDSAVCNLVERVKGQNPDDAFEWARTLGNPSLRYEVLMSTLDGWAEKDSTAARAAVESLPAGDRGYMLEFLQKREKAKAEGQR